MEEEGKDPEEEDRSDSRDAKKVLDERQPIFLFSCR